MRKVHTANGLFYLNNEPYYQRLVLDQGYYPEGIWTAPTDEALKHDIELGKESGFNGARLHQKIFEERYYYWADKLGYITWGESPAGVRTSITNLPYAILSANGAKPSYATAIILHLSLGRLLTKRGEVVRILMYD